MTYEGLSALNAAVILLLVLMHIAGRNRLRAQEARTQTLADLLNQALTIQISQAEVIQGLVKREVQRAIADDAGAGQ